MSLNFQCGLFINLVTMECGNPSKVAQNPFAALFPSVEEAEEYSKKHEESIVQTHNVDTLMQTQPIRVSIKEIHSDTTIESECSDMQTSKNDEKDRAWMMNDLLQRMFLITVDDGKLFIC